MACIPPNPRRVGYIDPIHGPLYGPLYMGSHIHQHYPHSEIDHITKVETSTFRNCSSGILSLFWIRTLISAKTSPSRIKKKKGSPKYWLCWRDKVVNSMKVTTAESWWLLKRCLSKHNSSIIIHQRKRISQGKRPRYKRHFISESQTQMKWF